MNPHRSEHELLRLLIEDGDQILGDEVAEHVESCALCQNKLEMLSAQGTLTNEMLAHLRTLGNAESELHVLPPLTSVEWKDEHSDSDSIELDPVSLEFLEPAKHPELLGRIGRYDIERVIGSGGMGVVFKAHDGELHRSVAIKVLAPHLAHSAAARKRFAREAKAAAAVLHPNVIPIHNVESDGKIPYLVMQYVSGESLQTRVDAKGPLPVTDVLRIAQQTAAGLSAAHGQGLIHRDVKPANILLEESVDRVVLSDFGLARTVDDASLTRTGIVTGTPHYMSPEQANGESIDCRSDQFSLGCVIYFMLTGRPPFRAATAMGVLNRICHDAHRPVHQVNSEVPLELSRLVDRLLAKSANARFETSAAIDHELSKLLFAFQNGGTRYLYKNAAKRIELRSFSRTTKLIACGFFICFIATVAMYWQTAFVNPTNQATKPLYQNRALQRNALQTKTSQNVQPVSAVAPTTASIATRFDPAIDQVQNFFASSHHDDWHQKLATLSIELAKLENVSESSNIQWKWLDQQTACDREAMKMLRWQLDLIDIDSKEQPLTLPKNVLH